MYRRLLLLLALGVLLSPTAGRAATRPHIDGYIDGPFVPTEGAARRIYLAARDAIAPGQRSMNLQVKINDEGDHWSVYAIRRVRQQDHGLVVVQGGGGLGLQINKCSGAVSNAAFAR